MKKKLSYRDKLLELAQIYNVKEVQEYIKRRKTLTSGQIELILRKNKIIIPKDFQTNFFKENVAKPLSRASKQIDGFKEDSKKAVSKFSRKLVYFQEDSSRSIGRFFYNLWKTSGDIGLNFLNIIPKLGKTVFSSSTSLLVNVFHGIYNQKINPSKARTAIISFFVIIGVVAILISGGTAFKNSQNNFKNQIVKKPEVKIKKEVKKPEAKIKKEVKKSETKIKKEVKKSETKIKKEEKAVELILPDLNLKTETVLTLFKDVNYDLKKVKFDKTVKPIYFTQLPKDLDELKNVKLKKETFIKIILPLIVAENERILDDRYKLKKITSRKITTDDEKQWLRQKFLEYRVKKGSVEDLITKMDIIPASIAIAQAAKESGWGTSRFALEGNAIFGQWTWNGQGIAPLDRDKTKSHKILRFPILRASVKAYTKNLNTHRSYVKFRDKRKSLRKENKKIIGLELTKTLDNYAQTGSEYTKILDQIIKQNRLMDYEPVKLTNSSPRKSLNL
ncbi:glucosaminidase domain-containing protein [Pelagibacteraceae bacterium]|nr:glucosaminidase domain-containing protein [Pelagibacteraceae bacterium]